MTLGVAKLEDGGFLIMIYFWGGCLGLLAMWAMLKIRPGGGIGRRARLKIWFPQGVRVRFPSWSHAKIKQNCDNV